MLDLIHKMLYTGIGAAVLTEQKARDIAADLEKRGEVSAEEGKQFTRELLDKAKKHHEELRQTIHEETSRLSEKYGWVSRREYNELKNRLDELEQRLNSQTGGV